MTGLHIATTTVGNVSLVTYERLNRGSIHIHTIGQQVSVEVQEGPLFRKWRGSTKSIEWLELKRALNIRQILGVWAYQPCTPDEITSLVPRH